VIDPAAEGVTLTEVLVTVPTCWFMLSEVAPVTTQLSVICEPSATVLLDAEKLVITAVAGCAAVTVMD
jgi:hypothetical protein